MSVMLCDGCDLLFDTDYDEMEEIVVDAGHDHVETIVLCAACVERADEYQQQN
jgi:hypothetical protein